MREDLAQRKTKDAGSVNVWATSREHADRRPITFKKTKLSADFMTEMTVKEFGVGSFVLFNDTWSQIGHSASNTTVILA